MFPVKIDGKKTPYVDIDTNPWPANMFCNVDPNKIVNRRTVYPSVKTEDITYVFNPPVSRLSLKISWKRNRASLWPCLIYRTPVEPRKIRHSPYCFYFQPKREGLTGPLKPAQAAAQTLIGIDRAPPHGASPHWLKFRLKPSRDEPGDGCISSAPVRRSYVLTTRSNRPARRQIS